MIHWKCFTEYTILRIVCYIFCLLLFSMHITEAVTINNNDPVAENVLSSDIGEDLDVDHDYTRIETVDVKDHDYKDSKDGYKVPDSVKFSQVPDSVKFSQVPDSVKFSQVPDSVKFSQVPDSVKFSQLPDCSDESKSNGSTGALLLVSTVDGYLTGLDYSTGKQRWRHRMGNENLLTSPRSKLMMQSSSGELVQVVPTLNGYLYQVFGNNYRMLPVTADELLAPKYKYSGNTFFTGSKSMQVKGVNAANGSELYHCSANGCHRNGHPYETVSEDRILPKLKDSDDVIILTKTVKKINAFNAMDGFPKFNFSVGQYDVHLARTGGCKATSINNPKLSDLPKPQFLLDDGIVKTEGFNGHAGWTNKLNSTIVDAWTLANGELAKINVLDLEAFPTLVPQYSSSNTQLPGPDLFVGYHEGQPFIIQSERMEKKAEEYTGLHLKSKAKLPVISPPSITNSEPYYSTRAGLLTAQERNKLLAIEYKPETSSDSATPNTELTTDLHPLWSDNDNLAGTELAEYINTSKTGYYLFTPEIILPATLPSKNELESQTTESAEREERIIGPVDQPYNRRHVNEEDLHMDERHTNKWNINWHLDIHSRTVQSVLVLLCAVFGMQLLAKSWYDWIKNLLIVAPISYLFKEIFLHLLSSDQEVRENIAAASLTEQSAAAERLGLRLTLVPEPIIPRNDSPALPSTHPDETSLLLPLPIPSNSSPSRDTQRHSYQPIIAGRNGDKDLFPYSDNQLPPDHLVRQHGFYFPPDSLTTESLGRGAVVTETLVNYSTNMPLHTTINTISEIQNRNSIRDQQIFRNQYNDLSNNSGAPNSIVTYSLDSSNFDKNKIVVLTGQSKPPECSAVQVFRPRQTIIINTEVKQFDEVAVTELNVGHSPSNLVGDIGGVAAPDTPPTGSDTAPTLCNQQSLSESNSNPNLCNEPTMPVSFRISEYQIKDILGWGGFGVVFTGYLALDDNLYAIKRIPLPSKLSSQERVLREVRVLAKLSHTNIVRYYYCWQESHSAEWVAEYDRPWHKRAGEKNFTQSYLAPATDTSCATDSLIRKSTADFDRNRHLKKKIDSKNDAGEEDSHLTGLKSDNPLYNIDQNFRNRQNEDDSFSIEFRKDTNNSSLSENRYNYNSDNSSDSEDSNIKSSHDNSNSIIFADVNSQSDNEHSKNSNEIIFKDSSEDEENNVNKDQRKKRINSFPPMNGHNASLSVRPESLAVKSSLSEDSSYVKQTKGIKDYLYIQMELCDPRSLKDWLQQDQQRPKMKVLKYFLDIVNAVEHVHDRQMMHRDLKPSNIFFDRFDEDIVKVGDFGLVTRILDDEEEPITARTPGVVPSQSSSKLPNQHKHTQKAGTESYMSPEQLNNEEYDYKVDVFSMGLILFEMLWVMTTAQEKSIVMKKLREQTFPEGFKERHPEEYDLLQLMLHPDSSKRPATRGIRARPPLTKLQLPHDLEKIKEAEHFTLMKKHKRNNSSLSNIELEPAGTVPALKET